MAQNNGTDIKQRNQTRDPEQTEAYNFNKPNHQAENQDVRTLANAINRIQI